MDDLNTIAKKLNKDLKESSEESFITVKSKEDAIVELKFEIVKYIIKVRLEEQAKRKTAQERAQKRALLKDLMERKALTELESKSMADLQAEIDALDALED
jgi:D-alanyl-D-alanine dipeptidase